MTTPAKEKDSPCSAGARARERGREIACRMLPHETCPSVSLTVVRLSGGPSTPAIVIPQAGLDPVHPTGKAAPGWDYRQALHWRRSLRKTGIGNSQAVGGVPRISGSASSLGLTAELDAV